MSSTHNTFVACLLTPSKTDSFLGTNMVLADYLDLAEKQ